MMTEITQTRLFSKHETKILETKVLYKSTKFKTVSEVTIDFEDLTRVKESYTISKDIFLIPSLISLIIALFCFFYMEVDDYGLNTLFIWFGLSAIFGTIYHLTKETLWKVKLQNGAYLFFYKKNPSTEIVDQFIENLFDARDKYLREVYFFEANRNLSYEAQKSDLQWLRRIEAINLTEFKTRKKELDEIFQQESKKIGFN